LRRELRARALDSARCSWYKMLLLLLLQVSFYSRLDRGGGGGWSAAEQRPPTKRKQRQGGKRGRGAAAARLLGLLGLPHAGGNVEHACEGGVNGGAGVNERGHKKGGGGVDVRSGGEDAEAEAGDMEAKGRGA
jgi:hypothetical protein